MEQTTIFMSNRLQTIRLPKAVALPEEVKLVDVVAVGRTRIISPAGDIWDSWFDGPGVSEDFMAERDQPAVQEREKVDVELPAGMDKSPPNWREPASRWLPVTT